MEKSDILILATRKNLYSLKMMLPYCRQNIIGGGEIYVVTNSDLKNLIDDFKGVIWIDEDHVLEGLTLKKVEDILYEICEKKTRAGWYLQQFLKLAWAYRCKKRNYIVIDADTIPLNKIVFQNENGGYYFTRKIEYNRPYFETIDNLFSGTVKRELDGSFVAEHMIFNCEYVKNMLENIMENAQLVGTSFYEKILHAVSPDEIQESGFSEFETYGNWMLKYHPNEVVLRSLRTQREAVYLLGSKPTKDQLLWAENDYDLISIELNEYKKTFMVMLTSNKIVRSVIHMSTLAKIRSKVRSFYRKIMGRDDFKFEES